MCKTHSQEFSANVLANGATAVGQAHIKQFASQNLTHSTCCSNNKRAIARVLHYMCQPHRRHLLHCLNVEWLTQHRRPSDQERTSVPATMVVRMCFLAARVLFNPREFVLAGDDK